MTKNLKKKYDELIDDLSRDSDDRYKDYLRDRPETFEYDNIIFDNVYLDRYYKCEGCGRRNPRAFCCTGHDLELTESDIETIEDVLPKVTKRFPRLAPLLKNKRFWDWGEDFEKIMRRKKKGDACIFLMPEGGCCFHAYALENGLDPLDVKPYVCGLYPLVVIVIGDEIVVTTVNEESERVLDTGGECHPCCTDKGADEDHAVIRSKDMLVRMFGEKVYNRLCKEMFED